MHLASVESHITGGETNARLDHARDVLPLGRLIGILTAGMRPSLADRYALQPPAAREGSAEASRSSFPPTTM